LKKLYLFHLRKGGAGGGKEGGEGGGRRHPDGRRIIPFDTYNLFYRDELERTRLAPLRELERAQRES